MKYTDLIENYGFARNMQETNWLKLFPHWWSENDPLLETIGKEVAFLKAQGIFTLLNTMVKPPVMIWQNSVIEKEYKISNTVTTLDLNDTGEDDSNIIVHQAPLYKTFGTIKLMNHSNEKIHNLKLELTSTDYIIIKNNIKPQDVVIVNVGDQTVTINNQQANVQKFGDGVSYFKTQQQIDLSNWNSHDYYFSNEVLRLTLTSDISYDIVNLDVEITLDEAVFINEQNIEITGLELVPIKNMELYVYYDFPFNHKVSGWQKVSEKKYIEDTNVVYDMITTKFNTKKFYVDVWYKGLDYPYRVGFPAIKNADDQSIYHVNKELDTWGEYFGLKRRFYKENIPEEDYPYTYPPYYPYDIEQDYWYYKRLINEYTYVEWAINDVDLLDTDGTPIVRLHSIDPFAEDLVVHAKSVYPENEDNIKVCRFTPTVVSQELLNDDDSEYRKSAYSDIQNLLKYDNNKAYITLRNKAGAGITYQQYLSKVLKLFFDLKDIEEDVHINDIQILVEAESTDNKDNKYSNQDTGLVIHGISDTHVFPMKQDSIYELAEKEITYNLSLSIKDILDYSNRIDSNIIHEITIGKFGGTKSSYIQIPFTLKEHDEVINDITDIYVTFDGIKTVTGEYEYNDGYSYIKVFIPKVEQFTTMSIACKTAEHNSFVVKDIPLINVEYIPPDNKKDDEREVHALYGPSKNGGMTVESDDNMELKVMVVTDQWHTGDLRDLIQKDGISFVNVFQNDDETNTPTILIKNVTLEVSYSPKQTDFELKTQIDYNVNKPYIAQLKVQVTNTGDKELNTVVDIVSATNLKLDRHSFVVDFGIGDIHTEYINIKPEYPLIDGKYEILTVCEDQSYVNNVYVFADGLIGTSVDIQDHYGVLGESITFNAKVNTVGQQLIDPDIGKVSFYVDGYYLGESFVDNNNATFILYPNNNNYKHLASGLHTLEARFSGTTKYKTSRAYAYLSILRTDIVMDITAMPNEIVYGQKYIGDVIFYNMDQTSFIPDDNVTNKVSFYIDNDFIGMLDIGIDGIVHFESDEINIDPGVHELTVNYHGNDHYVQQRQTKQVTIIGGETRTIVFDATVKPNDTAILYAKVLDSFNQPLRQGQVTFKINDDYIGVVDVENGIATVEYIARDEQVYTITASYHDTNGVYQDSQGTNKLTVKKGNVMIHCSNLFYASQYEPLGFYMTVTDVADNQPVQSGEVTVTIPQLGIEAKGTIDGDGGVRIVYNVVNFSSKDLKDLEKFRFLLNYTTNDVHRNQILSYDYDDDIASVLMDFYLDNDILKYVYENTNKYVRYDSENNIVVNELPPGFEQIYIENGHLYARTNVDTLRQYLTGKFDVFINYHSHEGLYNDYNTESSIFLKAQQNNIDLLSYDLVYNEQNESLTCYVSEYNLDDNEYNPINQGSVQFYVDDVKIGQSSIVEGRAILPPTYLKDIEHGNHLLQAVYIPVQGQNNTYTYTTLQLRKIRSSTNADFVTKLKGRKNQLDVTVCIGDEYSMPIEGDVEVYMNDVKIASDYLFGIESSAAWIEETEADTSVTNNCATLSFMVDVPEDADLQDYNICVKYLGNKYIEESEYVFTFVHAKIDTNLSVQDIKVAQGEICHLNVEVASELNDFINEGEVILYASDNSVITKSNVRNNKATLVWENSQYIQDYAYTVKYANSEHYNDKAKGVTVSIIEPLTDIYIIQNIEHIDDDTSFNDLDFYDIDDELKMTDIHNALQCLAPNGNLHIVNEVTVTNHINIDKDLNIIGHNNAKIIKDIGDLLNGDGNIKTYNIEEFDQVIYEIVGLTPNYINDRDFCIIDNDLYYITQQNEFIPIFLLNDGSFYSYQLTPLYSVVQNVSININDAKVHIHNIEFMTNDSDDLNDFVINNRGHLNITKCVLNKKLNIVNYNVANINCNLVYCDINNYGTINQDNNWWGSNTIYDESINNHIIFTLWTDEDPAVIGEDIHIYGQLIGMNGFEYELPPLEFFFEAADGFFSIDTGYTIDNNISTIYYDSTKEDKVYCTIDNETLSLDILNYDRKTEVILESIDLPIGYQIELMAKVHSCADYYYNNKIVDNGYVTFYLDDRQIGYASVKSGKAILSTYLSPTEYVIPSERDSLTEPIDVVLTATYTPNDYYFASKSNVDVHLINPEHVCYVSTDGDNNNDGSFNSPVQSIATATYLNKQRIYLKEGVYEDKNINVHTNLNIKKYSGDVIFKDSQYAIFIGNINNNYTLNLDGLIFENNNAPIAKEIHQVNIDHCILQDNTTTNLFENISIINVDNSVLLNNNIFINDLSSSTRNINYCWYGCNLNDFNNDERESITGLPSGLNEPNTHIVMTVESSKDKIYVGSVAKIITSLNKYVHENNDQQYNYNGTLPLRTAFFRTDIGSIVPTKDYTYNNQAIAFLNTNDENKNDDLIITFPDNTNYINQNVKLKCYVNDIFGADINNITVHFDIINSKNEKVRQILAITENGCATITTMALPIDTYTLICRTEDGYQGANIFNIVPPYIKVVNCSIDNRDHLYTTELTLQCTDPFGYNIQSQEVDIYIDDVYVDHATIDNGELYTILNYNNIEQGPHVLKISTKNYISDFEVLDYEYNFNSDKKNTWIDFKDFYLAPNEPTDLVIWVYDDNNKLVTDGYVDIRFDDEHTETIILQNGIAVYEDCQYDIGEHIITVYYSGDNYYYNKALRSYPIQVGIKEVTLTPKVTPITADIGASLKFDMQVFDYLHRKVNRGTISVSLNDVYFKDEYGNDILVDVINGECQWNTDLPIGIQSNAVCSLKVRYHDDAGKYADSFYKEEININAIPTQILVDTIYGSPGLITDPIDFNVESSQGTVTTGLLIAEYNGEEIGQAMVSDINTSIILHLPYIAADEIAYVDFKYISDNSFYANSNITVPLVMEKSNIKISTISSSYYPKQTFNFFAYCKDQNDQNLSDGELTLYIDNVKHSTRPIVNGEVVYSLKFNTVKEYQLLLVYEENEYYKKTHYPQTFSVHNIPITNINILGSLEYYPNDSEEIELVFTTENNLDVNDGRIDIFLDNNKIHTYSIMQGSKHVLLNIPNIAANDNYELRLEYYDSLTFNNYSQTYNVSVKSLSTNITVQPITAQTNNEVCLRGDFNGMNLTGTVEYYLEHNHGRRLIGVDSIRNQEYCTYNYMLPNDLDSDEYTIVIRYTGDDQHYPAEGYGTLSIEKSEIEISYINVNEYYESSDTSEGNSIPDIGYTQVNNLEYDVDVIYKHKIKISFHTNIYDGDYNFNIGLLKDDIIYPLGVITSSDGYADDVYELDNDINVGEYQLYIAAPSSIVFHEYDSTEQNINIKVNVIPTECYLKDEPSIAYIGGYVTLPHRIVDSDGVDLTGTLEYMYDGQILTPDDNYRIICNNQHMDIDIRFTPNNQNFDIFYDFISIDAIKNQVIITIESDDTIHRGQELPIEITLDSLTAITSEVRNQLHYINYKILIENQQITRTNNKIKIPLSLPDKAQYILQIKYDGDTYYNDFDAKFILKNKDVERIVVGNEDNENTTTTLSQALNLIADGGIIEISKDLADETCVNNKQVSIAGNEHTLSNCTIQNDGVLTIHDLTFRNSHDSVIKTNNKLYINDCTFMYNQAQYGAAIYIDSQNQDTEITNCTFNYNNASLYGGAIFSNKGNNVTIEYSTFGQQNRAETHGSSISTNGNMYLNNNIFYNNDGNDEIYVMSGSLEAENNYFDGGITSINNLNGEVAANLNYWGYNDIIEIDTKAYKGQVLIDNWLYSDYEIRYTEPVLGDVHQYIIGHINKFKSRLEPDITNYKELQGKVVKVDGFYHNLNDEIETNVSEFYIGQVKFTLD